MGRILLVKMARESKGMGRTFEQGALSMLLVPLCRWSREKEFGRRISPRRFELAARLVIASHNLLALQSHPRILTIPSSQSRENRKEQRESYDRALESDEMQC